MSLNSLLSAAQSAVEMSDAAASAAEDAMAAAKLASVHAKAALAAAQLAVQLEGRITGRIGQWVKESYFKTSDECFYINLVGSSLPLPPIYDLYLFMTIFLDILRQ